MFDYPELVERYKKLEKWDGDWVNYWTVTAGEEDAEDKGMGDQRPPTPKKIRMANHGHTGVGEGALYESEFEKAMQKAREQEEKRQGKDGKKREEENRKRAEKEEAEKLRRDQGTFLKKELEAERDRVRRIEKERKSKDGTTEGDTPTTKNHRGDSQGSSAASSALPDVLIEKESKPVDSSTSIKEGSHSLPVSSHSLSPPQIRTPSRSPSPSQPPTQSPDAAHHFITLPSSSHEQSRRRWLKVKIAGVNDEVAAHCGIFIRGQNLEYEAFVDRVGALVESWVL